MNDVKNFLYYPNRGEKVPTQTGSGRKIVDEKEGSSLSNMAGFALTLSLVAKDSP